MRLAILASGSGTTAEAVAQATRSGQLEAEIGLIIHNNAGAKVVEQPTVRELLIPTMCINGLSHPDVGVVRKGEMGDNESQAVVDAIKSVDAELVLLLGYMKRVRGALLDQYGYNPEIHSEVTDARMLNTHPGPLPQTMGLHGSQVHQHVYELYQARELAVTGPTLHAVAEDYDTGPTVRYFDMVDLSDADTAESIEDRVRAVEREQLPVGIQFFIEQLRARP